MNIVCFCTLQCPFILLTSATFLSLIFFFWHSPLLFFFFSLSSSVSWVRSSLSCLAVETQVCHWHLLVASVMLLSVISFLIPVSCVKHIERKWSCKAREIKRYWEEQNMLERVSKIASVCHQYRFVTRNEPSVWTHPSLVSRWSKFKIEKT